MSIEETNMHERVDRVFQMVFDDPAIRVKEETTAADIPEWDSIKHINLIVALEEEFAIQFASEDIASMDRVADLFALLRRKLSDGRA